MVDEGEVSDGDGPYEAGARCRWTLICQELGFTPELSFASFDLESDFDYVYINDGSLEDGPRIYALSGDWVPPQPITVWAHRGS